MMSKLIVAALGAGALYCAAVGFLALQQRRFLYFPDTTRPVLPATVVPTARTLTVHTEDRLDLLAWLAPPANDAQPVVLYLHGNGGNIGYRAMRFARLSRLGWGVLLLEYRGYGGNPGTISESGLTIDAQAGFAALRGLGFSPERILLWGESLGSGIAARLGSEQKPAAVLLESPYTSIAAIAKVRYPWVPVDLLLRDRFDTMAVIGKVEAPVFVMHGAHDAIVPLAMGRAVFAAAHGRKALWIAPDAGHVDLVQAGAIEAAGEFVRKTGP